MRLKSAPTLSDLKLNPKVVLLSDFLSLAALFLPALMFGVGICLLAAGDPKFGWVIDPYRYPWELWLLATAGVVATVGGVGDWIFHRLYVTAGPAERRCHLLALGTGGVPLALLMSAASVVERSTVLLLPIIVVVLYTTTLICYDEFQFHTKRCTQIETLMHRFLVFGNGTAWLAWMHWVYVRGGVHGM